MPARKKSTVKRRKKRRNRGKIVLAVFLLISVAILVGLSLTVFFNITDIKVKGDTRYSSEEIIKESGIRVGDNMFLLADGKIEDELTEELPYLASVTLERNLPDKLVISVKEIAPEYAFKVDGKYLLVGKDKALDSVDKLPKNIALVKCDIEEYEIGKPFSIGEKEETFTKITSALKENSLTKITEIDITDTSKITMVYDNRLNLEFGSMEDLQKKMKKAIQIIKSVDADYNNKAMGTIRLQYEDGYFEKATSSVESTSSAPTSSQPSNQE